MSDDTSDFYILLLHSRKKNILPIFLHLFPCSDCLITFNLFAFFFSSVISQRITMKTKSAISFKITTNILFASFFSENKEFWITFNRQIDKFTKQGFFLFLFDWVLIHCTMFFLLCVCSLSCYRIMRRKKKENYCISFLLPACPKTEKRTAHHEYSLLLVFFVSAAGFSFYLFFFLYSCHVMWP